MVDDDDGQRYALVVVEGHLPAVGVAQVLEDNLFGVELLLFVLSLARVLFEVGGDL